MLYRKLGGTAVDPEFKEHIDFDLNLQAGDYAAIVVLTTPISEDISLNLSLDESDYFKQVTGDNLPQVEDEILFNLFPQEGDYFLQVTSSDGTGGLIDESIGLNLTLNSGEYPDIVLDSGAGRYDDTNFMINLSLEGGSYDNS